MNKFIEVRGACVNNLKNVDVDIPLNSLVCFFGASGSGKSSLAFHTLYSESKRRFLNSFPTYLKFFSDRPAPVDVERITPVLPVFGLPQINPVVGTRSNIADTMHLTELLQNLFYHYGEERCPIHQTAFSEFKFSEYIKELVGDLEGVFTIFMGREDFNEHFSERPFPSRSLKSKRSKKIEGFDDEHEFWEVFRFKNRHIADLDEKAKDYLDSGVSLYLYSPGLIKITKLDFRPGVFGCPEQSCESKKLINKGIMHFSPYNALGACNECSGFGEVLNYDLEKLVDQEKSVKDQGVLLLKYKRFSTQEKELLKTLKKKKISVDKPIKDLPKDFWNILYEGEGQYGGFNTFFKYLERKRYKMHVRVFIRSIQKGEKCKSCSGSRLKPFSKQFFLSDQFRSLFDFSSLNIDELYKELTSMQKFFYGTREFHKNLSKVISILESAIGIGLGHLYLHRKSKSVSAGEYQRLLLLKYLSYEGTGALFIFDEPSLGLSIVEQKELFKSFKRLITQKNTVILVDHSEFFKKSSDYIVEMGPGSGALGGNVLFQGKTKEYKFKKFKIDFSVEKLVRPQYISVEKPEIYNQSFMNFKVPIDGITWAQGRSGSGKSSSLVNIMGAELYYRTFGKRLDVTRGQAKDIKCSKVFKNILVVDANLNRYTSRSSVGSMTELFGVVRKHFAKTTMAQALGLKDGHFSYHSELGQCPRCQGKGVEIIEMQFLEDIVLKCEDCDGKRLKPVYSGISDGNMTVHEAFSRPLGEVLKNIKLTPKFQRIFEYLKILNLDYLSLNRGITSLSGGEKQRIYLLNKLLKEVSDSLVILENISFGLSVKELSRVCGFLQDLNRKSNTIIIIDQDEIFQNISHHELKFS